MNYVLENYLDILLKKSLTHFYKNVLALWHIQMTDKGKKKCLKKSEVKEIE